MSDQPNQPNQPNPPNSPNSTNPANPRDPVPPPARPSVNNIAPTRDQATPPKAAPQMVSVNARGGGSLGSGKRVMIFCIVGALLLSGGVFGTNKLREWQKEKAAKALAEGKQENKAALVGRKRSFNSDPGPAPAKPPKAPVAESSPPCLESMLLLDANGQPVLSVSGAPMRICKDGKIFMPPGGAPIPMAQNKPPAQSNPIKPPSRFGGELMVPSKENAWSVPQAHAPTPHRAAPIATTGGDANAQFARFLQARNVGGAPPAPAMMPIGQPVSQPAGAPIGQPPGGSIKLSQATAEDGDPAHRTGLAVNNAGGSGAPSATGNPHSAGPSGGAVGSQGAIGTLLSPSKIPSVTAKMLGNRSMILPRGRSIDCSLATRVVNEVSGMAECVLASDVYSDNGKVVLLERGSQASGEYVALMTQGQRRLFILWSRVRTPNGVVIDLASPSSDALGAAGIGGYVDHRWGERLGAAVLLSMVKDAISLATAKAVSSGGGGAGAGIYAFQTTSSTGERMVTQVLNSTINIRPTLYANQGDRAAIYVARDLDFGSVYELRSR